jgi:competence protein ComEA
MTRRTGPLARLDAVTVRLAARTGVSPRAVIGLAVVLVLVVTVLGVRALHAHAVGRPVPLAPAGQVAAVTPSAATTTGPLTSGSPTAGVSGATASEAAAAVPGTTPTAGAPGVVVDVVGLVQHPGVVRLAAGARVEDAVDAAGGARHGADLAAINLARVLVDGEQVVVPRPGQAVPAAGAGAAVAGTAGAPGSGASSGVGGSAAAPAGPVDLNTATEEQLDALPGVGPVLAGRILEWRAQHGRFSTVDELSEVSGIGDKVLENLRPLVRV